MNKNDIAQLMLIETINALDNTFLRQAIKTIATFAVSGVESPHVQEILGAQSTYGVAMRPVLMALMMYEKMPREGEDPLKGRPSSPPAASTRDQMPQGLTEEEQEAEAKRRYVPPPEKKDIEAALPDEVPPNIPLRGIGGKDGAFVLSMFLQGGAAAWCIASWLVV